MSTNSRKRRRQSAARWSVYVVRTARDTLYTGIALDVARRLAAHARGRGARALRGKGPLQLAYRCAVGAKGLALRVEHRIKQLTRPAKERLVASAPARGRLLRGLGLGARRDHPTA